MTREKQVRVHEPPVKRSGYRENLPGPKQRPRRGIRFLHARRVKQSPDVAAR